MFKKILHLAQLLIQAVIDFTENISLYDLNVEAEQNMENVFSSLKWVKNWLIAQHWRYTQNSR